MGVFFWRKKKTNQNPRRVAVDRQQALAAWRRLREYQELERLIGPTHCAALIQMLDEYIANAIQWMDYEDEAHELFIPMISGFLQHELRMIRDLTGQITRLWGQADTGAFSQLLDRNNLPPGDWRIPTNPLEDDLWKGVNWINSHDPSVERRRKTLRLMMKLQRDFDPRSKTAFDICNIDLVGLDEALKFRKMNRETNYPSSVGGQALAEMIEGLAMTANVRPGDGNPKWDDIACFLYGAYIRAQSARDGNKRSSRAIYVAALRKGGRPVRVPSRALEATLLGPNWII